MDQLPPLCLVSTGLGTGSGSTAISDTLREREAGVMKMRFGLTDGQPKPVDEIGKVYGGTTETTRRIESKTRSKLRHRSRS